MSGDIGGHVIRGSAWMIAMRWTMLGIGLFSTILLARLLAPEDFGVLAMALIVVGLLETVSFNGVDLALIRNETATREHYDTAWTVQLIQSGIVALLLLLVAAPAGDYFDEPRTVAVIQLLALKPLLDGLQNIGVVAFRKELDFAKEFRFNVYKKLINFMLIVSAALLLRNYWALALGAVSAAAISTGLSYGMHPYRPRLSLAKIREIWGFSQWLLLYHIGFYLSRKLPHFVVGGSSGTKTMGGYHLASEISTMPCVELIMPLHRAFFPALAKVQTNAVEFRHAVRKTFALVSAACCLLGFGLSAVADLFVPLVLGEQWLDIVPLMRWLALFGIFSGMMIILEVPLWVYGKTRASAMLTWSQLLLLVPLVLAAVESFGAEGAAASRLITGVAMVPLIICVVCRFCPLTPSDLFAVIWRPLTAGAVMALSLAVWQPFVATGPVALAALLALKAASGAVIYISVLLGLWLLAGRPDGAESFGVEKFAGRLRLGQLSSS